MTDALSKDREYLEDALLKLDQVYTQHPSMSTCVGVKEYVAKRDVYYRDLVLEQGSVIQAMANILTKMRVDL